MTRPPLWMKIRVRNEEHNFRLWLPLFLLLPLALVVLIILSPIIIIGLIIFWDSWGMWSLKVIRASVMSFWNMRGLEVDVQNGKEMVFISVV